MKLSTTLVAASCLLAAAPALYGRQPLPTGPQQEVLPAPQYLDGEAQFDFTTDENVWCPPPMPPLPYGFTWDGYYGAEVEHDIYGYQRLHPPAKRTVSCHGWLAGVTDTVVVAFSYPTPHRPLPEYCPKGNGRIPGKLSYNVHRGCGGSCGASCGSCTCQAHATTMTYEPAHFAPHPLPQSEQPVNVLQQQLQQQQRVAPARPLIPPVLIDDTGTGLPALPLVQTEERGPAVIAPSSPPPVLTEDPRELPLNTIPAPSDLPRNKIPASGR